jgi:hypothetical protein
MLKRKRPEGQDGLTDRLAGLFANSGISAAVACYTGTTGRNEGAWSLLSRATNGSDWRTSLVQTKALSRRWSHHEMEIADFEIAFLDPGAEVSAFTFG